jgi:hypothetical protein
MSLFADFIGGAAKAAKTNIDNEMAEKADQKRAEWRLKAQEKYGIRAENRAEKRQIKSDELAYDRLKIQNESDQRAEEIKQKGLLQQAQDKAAFTSEQNRLNRVSNENVARMYSGNRGGSTAKAKQEMDFGFNNPVPGLLGRMFQ